MRHQNQLQASMEQLGFLWRLLKKGQESKENAVEILLGVSKYDRERNRGLILREGVMPGMLQVSVNGIERGKEMARELLLLLRDCCSGFAMKHSKIEIVQQIMQEIDHEAERVPEVMLKFVEDLISKLTNSIFPLQELVCL